MKNKIILIMVSAVLCLSIVGCGGKDNEVETSEVEIEEVTDEEVETSEEGSSLQQRSDSSEEIEEESETEMPEEVEEIAEEMEPEEADGEWVYDEENNLWVWNQYVDGETISSGMTIQVLTEEEVNSEASEDTENTEEEVIESDSESETVDEIVSE